MVTQLITWLLHSIASLTPILRELIAMVAILFETSLFLGLIVPGDTIVIVAGTAVTEFGSFFALLFAVLIGSLIGESIGFWLGRTFGTRLRASKLGQKIGERNWQMADTFVETRGGIAVAISRFLPVLHSLVPVVAGMTKMRYRTFITWTVGACTIWAAAYISLGWIAGASWAQFSGNLKWGGAIFAGIILVIAVAFHFGKQRLEKAAERMIEQGEVAQAAVAGGIEVQPESDVK